MVDMEELVGALARVRKNENSLGILLTFEGILDHSHLYAYENWIDGEIIRGPVTSKHWVEVDLMYPVSKMPNPRGAMRLVNMGCHIQFRYDDLLTSVRIRSRSDLVPDKNRAGKYRPKRKKIPIIVFTFQVPRQLFKNYESLKADTMGQAEDLDELVAAYDSGLDVERDKGS